MTQEEKQYTTLKRVILAARTIGELNRIVAEKMNLSLPAAMFARLARIAEVKQWEMYNKGIN